MEDFDIFIKSLKVSLKNLPGFEAQLKMAPITRLSDLMKNPTGKPPRKSAVLILFYPDNGEIKTVLIERAADNTVHSLQISFPGGKFENIVLAPAYNSFVFIDGYGVILAFPRLPYFSEDVPNTEIFNGGENFRYFFAQELFSLYVFRLFGGGIKINKNKIVAVIHRLVYGNGSGKKIEKLFKIFLACRGKMFGGY